MKVGILTYHRSNNVGAVLQNYALQQVLNKYGVENETIDYKCDFIEQNNRILFGKNLKANLKKLIELNTLIKREHKFKEFRKKYLLISPKVYSQSSIQNSNEIYDLFISGSDQVWNMKLNREDYNYFLKFVKDDSKKIAYAASFGYSVIPNEYEENTLNYLNKFKYISVREKQSKELLANYNIKSDVVLDPTLLLDSNKWEKIIKNLNIKKKFIFIYMVAYTPEILNVAIKYGKKNNYDVYCMHYNYKNFNNVKNVRSVSPDEFLYYIKNAEIVFCSSYHAVCFSILFKKKFFVALDASVNNNNSRINTLLSNLDLNERIFEKNKEYNDEIDYRNTFIKLEKLKDDSFKFIEKTIMERNA